MSLKKNILANYASQFYVALTGIVMVPLYIRYMGAEAYGLVGFYAMLQAWFMLLDMGLTPTMARETARFRGGAIDAVVYRRFVRTLEGIFLVAALVGGTALFWASEYVSHKWLQASALPLRQVQTAIQLMAIIIALRWMGGLYRGAISGSERLIWLGGYDAIIATLRFFGVLPVLVYVGATPTVFFGYQMLVAFLEMTGLMVYGYLLLPDGRTFNRAPWDWRPIKPVLKFSLSLAFTSIVWILVTQTDKLVLSKLLSLAHYGYFTAAVLVANGVNLISAPISTAILPRMSKLEAEGDHSGLIRIYRDTTQIVAVLASATAVTLAFCAEPLLAAWTRDGVLAHQAAPVLTLYALGNGFLAVAAFPYYLQYAKGNLRLHLIGNAVFVVLLVPLIVWATSRYGMVGAGYVWLLMNLVSFVAWLPFVHRKFEPGLNFKWYCLDTLPIFAMTLIVAYSMSNLVQPTHGIWIQLGEIVVTWLLLVAAGAFASSAVRTRAHHWFAQRGIHTSASGS